MTCSTLTKVKLVQNLQEIQKARNKNQKNTIDWNSTKQLGRVDSNKE